MRKDLAILVPDRDYEVAIPVLLRRSRALGTRPITFDISAHADHDPGCLLKSAEFLRQYLPTHRHALVLFDREGCGKEKLDPARIEELVARDLSRCGWHERAAAVVLDPELEVWIWVNSPEVDRCLCWSGRHPGLREWLCANDLWPKNAPKPGDPKEALMRALAFLRRPRSPSVYAALAASVHFGRCTDRAFIRFREILQRWFPAS